MSLVCSNCKAERSEKIKLCTRVSVYYTLISRAIDWYVATTMIRTLDLSVEKPASYHLATRVGLKKEGFCECDYKQISWLLGFSLFFIYKYRLRCWYFDHEIKLHFTRWLSLKITCHLYGCDYNKYPTFTRLTKP